jgi:hypothetical protein
VAIGTFDEFMALSVIDVLTMTTKSTQSIFSPFQLKLGRSCNEIGEQTLGSVKLSAANLDVPLCHLRGSQRFIILSGNRGEMAYPTSAAGETATRHTVRSES